MNEATDPVTGAVVSVDMMGAEGPRVHISGEIDFRGAPAIRKQIKELLKGGHKRVYVHLADVIFIDSSGISALLDSANVARELDARLTLVSPTHEVMHILDMSGFTSLFEIEHPAVAYPAPMVAPRPREMPVSWQMSEFAVPCQAELVADIRRRVGQIANCMPFSNEEVEDIKLGVGEAASNAFRHGCGEGGNSVIKVRCVGDSTGLTVEIADAGKGFDPAHVPELVKGSLAAGGRGISFMKLTMDEVEFRRQKKGMLVRMVKRIKPSVGGPPIEVQPAAAGT